MTRLIVALGLVVFLAACGGSDSGSGQDAGSGQAASSAAAESGGGASSGDAAKSGGGASSGDAAKSADYESCLSLVKQAEFQQAVTPCTRALREYPGNQELQAALDEAKKGAAAAMVDTDAAADEAKAKLGEAAGGMKLP